MFLYCCNFTANSTGVATLSPLNQVHLAGMPALLYLIYNVSHTRAAHESAIWLPGE